MNVDSTEEKLIPVTAATVQGREESTVVDSAVREND